jgi:5-(carboxyamino)imidazole ribonucleotide mutase
MIKIVIGSKSDYDVIRKAFDIGSFFFDDPKAIDVSVASAHRSPERVKEVIEQAEKDGFKVFIACAGGASHLAGAISARTTCPVIGVPMKTEMMGGLDSLLSVSQMPSGVPVATVAINGIENAVILAVQILAISNKDLKERLLKYKELLVTKVCEQNEHIREAVEE